MNNNKKFQLMYFGKLKTVIFCLLLIGSLVSAIVEILFLTGILKSGGNIPLYAVSLTLLVLIFLIALYVLCFSSYIFKDEHLIVLFIFPEKIKYKDIYEIKYNRILKTYYLVILKIHGDIENYIEYPLNINEKDFDDFYSTLRDTCPSLMYEIFSNSKNNKNNRNLWHTKILIKKQYAI